MATSLKARLRACIHHHTYTHSGEFLSFYVSSLRMKRRPSRIDFPFIRGNPRDESISFLSLALAIWRNIIFCRECNKSPPRHSSKGSSGSSDRGEVLGGRGAAPPTGIGIPIFHAGARAASAPPANGIKV